MLELVLPLKSESLENLNRLVFNSSEWILKKEELLPNQKALYPLPIGYPIIFKCLDVCLNERLVKDFIRKEIDKDNSLSSVNAYSYNDQYIDIVTKIVSVQLYKI